MLLLPIKITFVFSWLEMNNLYDVEKWKEIYSANHECPSCSKDEFLELKKPLDTDSVWNVASIMK